MDLIENYYFYQNYEISDDSDVEEVHIYRRQPRRYRVRPDNLNDWNDTEFYNRFRLSKASVRRIYNLIYEDIKTKTN